MYFLFELILVYLKYSNMIQIFCNLLSRINLECLWIIQSANKLASGQKPKYVSIEAMEWIYQMVHKISKKEKFLSCLYLVCKIMAKRRFKGQWLWRTKDENGQKTDKNVNNVSYVLSLSDLSFEVSSDDGGRYCCQLTSQTMCTFVLMSLLFMCFWWCSSSLSNYCRGLTLMHPDI